jgi:hypothetical protein
LGILQISRDLPASLVTIQNFFPDLPVVNPVDNERSIPSTSRASGFRQMLLDSKDQITSSRCPVGGLSKSGKNFWRATLIRGIDESIGAEAYLYSPEDVIISGISGAC